MSLIATLLLLIFVKEFKRLCFQDLSYLFENENSGNVSDEFKQQSFLLPLGFVSLSHFFVFFLFLFLF